MILKIVVEIKIKLKYKKIPLGFATSANEGKVWVKALEDFHYVKSEQSFTMHSEVAHIGDNTAALSY